MDKFKLAGICVLASTLALSGCVARTYNLTRDRVDQDLSSSGNRGYLMGQAPQAGERAATRTVRVFEIELGRNKSPDPSYPATTAPAGAIEEVVSIQEKETQNEPVEMSFEKYTVAKNDTLQKISKKFYGTTKRWTKIYEANKDILRGPDKLYVGQALKIPNPPGLKKGKTGDIVETEENLK